MRLVDTRSRIPGRVSALLVFLSLCATLPACLDRRSPKPPPRVPTPRIEAVPCAAELAAQEAACAMQP